MASSVAVVQLVVLLTMSQLAGYDLGRLQSGVKLGDVMLPKWARTPEEFIRLHREALVGRGGGRGGLGGAEGVGGPRGPGGSYD